MNAQSKNILKPNDLSLLWTKQRKDQKQDDQNWLRLPLPVGDKPKSWWYSHPLENVKILHKTFRLMAKKTKKRRHTQC